MSGMKCVEKNGSCILEKYEGNETRVTLPDRIGGSRLTGLGPKAFLSCAAPEILALSEHVEVIGDWAFAHMKNLREIIMPARRISFGKKVFLGCNHLKRISFPDMEEIYEGIPGFLASWVVSMEEPEVDLALAGDPGGQWEWLKRYDAALVCFLKREDIYGFEPAFIGWFDIQDVDDQQAGYIREKRRCKAGLAYQRLLFDKGLEEEGRKAMEAYLLHNRELLLELFTEEDSIYSRDVRYMKVWEEMGGFEVISCPELLEKLPDADAEIRAFLMDCIMAGSDGRDFFDGLKL